MNTLGVAAIKAVTEMLEALGHATPTIKSLDAQGNQLVLALLRQAMNDMDVLPWKVLMDEKNPHEFRVAAAIPPCPEILPGAAAGRTPCAA